MLSELTVILLTLALMRSASDVLPSDVLGMFLAILMLTLILDWFTCGVDQLRRLPAWVESYLDFVAGIL